MSAAAFLKRSYSCSRRTSSARGSSSPSSALPGPRQQHARFDLGQGGRHQQIFPRQFQLQVLHQLDVLRVLQCDFGDRDIEDVDVLSPDQIQQQIERAFKGLQENLQRLRRDIQVARQLRDGLAVDHRKGHLDLFRRERWRRRGGGIGHHDLQIRFHHTSL